MISVTQDDINRIFRRIKRSAEGTQCWVWQGGKTPDGRLIMRVDGVWIDVRRVLYAAKHRQQLISQNVKMICETPYCCRVDHISEGRKVTRRYGDENSARRYRDRVRRGESHPNSRLTQEFVGMLLRDLARGQSPTVLGRTHNLSQGTVRDIKTGRRWRDHPERIPLGLLPEQPHFR